MPDSVNLFHPGISRNEWRANQSLVGWMNHQFELLADGRVWYDLTYRSQDNDFMAHEVKDSHRCYFSDAGQADRAAAK